MVGQYVANSARQGKTSEVHLDALTLLSTTATAEGRTVVVQRISEQLQENTDLLRQAVEVCDV